MNLGSILPSYAALRHMMMETSQSFGERYVASKYARPSQSFGERYVASKYARPYRHKSRKALANWRSGNKKKLRQFAK